MVLRRMSISHSIHTQRLNLGQRTSVPADSVWTPVQVLRAGQQAGSPLAGSNGHLAGQPPVGRDSDLAGRFATCGEVATKQAERSSPASSDERSPAPSHSRASLRTPFSESRPK